MIHVTNSLDNVLWEWPWCFQVQPLMVWPSPLVSPISLIRHSHTHIRWSPFCFTHWIAGCSSRHHKNSYAKQAAFRARGNHQQRAHTHYEHYAVWHSKNLLEFKLTLSAIITTSHSSSDARIFALEYIGLNPERDVTVKKMDVVCTHM